MTVAELKMFKNQAEQVDELNWLPILVAMIKAKAIEDAAKEIKAGLDHIGRCV